MKNVKILIAFHGEKPPVEAPEYLPIHVGSGESQGVLRDDEGENISAKNSVYNELTAIYWAWKNYQAVGDPEYIGLCHYRRYFVWEKRKYPYYECDTFEEVRNSSALCEEEVQARLAEAEVLAPMRTRRKSVRYNYVRAHHEDDLNLALSIVDAISPNLTQYANEYLESKGAYFYNMFVLPKERFFAYASWLFAVLDSFEKSTAHPTERMFISEVLTGIYLYYLRKTAPSFGELPVLFVVGKKQKLGEAIRETLTNFREKKAGFMYCLRPLLLWFIPRKLMLRRRQKRVK